MDCLQVFSVGVHSADQVFSVGIHSADQVFSVGVKHANGQKLSSTDNALLALLTPHNDPSFDFMTPLI